MLIKKVNTTTTATTEIFKAYNNSTLFDAQDARNYMHFRASRFQIFVMGARHAPGTPREKSLVGLTATLLVTGACYSFSDRL